MRFGGSQVLVVGKVVLVLATLVCLSSMGGAMLFAFPVLVPLHWLAAGRSGPVAAGGWALLAALSIFQAGWMLSYLATGNVVLGFAVGGLAATGTAAWFILRTASRAAAPAPGA